MTISKSAHRKYMEVQSEKRNRADKSKLKDILYMK